MKEAAPPPVQRWRNAAFWLISNLLGRFIGFLRSILVARFLDPEVAGLGYLAISIGSGARTLLETGSSRVIITEPEVGPQLIASAFWIELTKGLVLGAVLFAFGAYALWGGTNLDPRVPMLGALLPLALAGLNPMLSVTERGGRHGRVAAFQSAGPLLGAMVLAVLLALGMGWVALPIAIASGQFVTVVLSHVLIERMRSLRARRAEVVHLLRKGSNFLAMGMGRYFGGLGIDAILALMGALNWVAPLRISIGLVQTVLQGLPAVVGRSSLAQDAALGRATGRTDLVPVHLESMVFIGSATAGLAAASFLALPPAALLLYGEAWDATTVVIPPLCAAMAVRAVSTPFGIALIAGRRYHVEARVSVAENLAGAILLGLAAKGDIRIGIYVMAAVNFLALCTRAAVMLTRSVPNTWSAVTIALASLGSSAAAVALGLLFQTSLDSIAGDYAAGALAGLVGSGLAYALSIAVKRQDRSV